MVAECKGSTLQIPLPTIVHGPEPVPPTFLPHTVSLISAFYPTIFLFIFQVAVFQYIFLPDFGMHF